MKAYITKKVQQNLLAHKAAILLKGVFNAVRQNCVRAVISTWVDKSSSVVIYCKVESHLQNVEAVIDEMLKCGDRKITLALAFPLPPDFSNTAPNLTIIRTEHQGIVALMRAKLFITPYVAYKRVHAPIGSRIVHFLVSLTNLDGVYADHHFDGYDYIYCAGQHQISDFVRLSRRRSLAGKTLIPGGYPKLDDQLCWVSERRQNNPRRDAEKVIVYAPTHVYPVNEKLASLRRYGEDIVRELLDADFSVVFRPHPVSFKDEDKRIVEKICVEHKNNPRFSLDKSKNYMEAYSSADLMVTDLSGTGFTFAFTFQRPAIFFVPNADAEVGLEGIQFQSRHEIGGGVRSISELGEKCKSLLEHQGDIQVKIAQFRDRTVFNLGSSAKYFCHCLPYIERGEVDKGWVVL